MLLLVDVCVGVKKTQDFHQSRVLAFSRVIMAADDWLCVLLILTNSINVDPRGQIPIAERL